MQLINAVIAVLVWVLAPLTLCIPDLSSFTIPEPHEIVDLIWTGNLTVGGPNVTLRGRSIKDINRKIYAIAPHFFAPRSTPPYESDSSVLAARNENRLVCDNVTNGYAYSPDVVTNGNMLYASSGLFRCAPPQPGSDVVCARAACTNNSAVFFCNYNTDHDAIATAARIGDYSLQINNWCADTDVGPNVKGQVFDSDNYTVVVGSDSVLC
ncbi:hypothetical protein F5Y16DRAFT_419987 [Xylariaceae sp. FL0255]|nr:hypothetical protein F5Y16DRAFT_419987 [Xylariaceae sp. FL0255]